MFVVVFLMNIKISEGEERRFEVQWVLFLLKSCLKV